MASIVLFAVLMFAGTARAEHFEIELTVQGSGGKATGHSDTSPPSQGLHPRPVFRAKRGEPLVMVFMFTSNFPHGTKKGVKVHYYVAAEKEAGTKEPPDLAKPAGPHGSFTMNFKPDGRCGMRQPFRIEQPGAYLVRVESEQSDSDHEHFAALDLIIE